MSNSVLRGASLVSALTLLSRFFGFIRDILIARMLGAGMLTDAFFVAFRIPNLARSLVAEGALTSAFIPTFASEQKNSLSAAKRCLRSAVSAFSLLSLLLVIVGSIFAAEVLSFFAPGLMSEGTYSAFAVMLLRIMLPFLWCMSIVALGSGALSSLKIYGSSAIGQVMMNIILICALLLSFRLEAEQRIIALAWGVLFAGILQVFLHFFWVKRHSLSLFPSAELRSQSNREIFRLMLPAAGATAVYQLGIVASTAIASVLPAGSISWLFYADRLAQLPLGVLSIALATVLLPALAASEKEHYSSKLEAALRYNCFMILPLSAFLFWEAESIIRLLFERGRFLSSDTSQAALALQGYSLGLVLVSSQLLLGRSFIADKDPKTPAFAAAVALGCSLLTAICLIGAPSDIESWLGQILLSIQGIIPEVFLFDLDHLGLALSPAAGALFGTVFLFIAAKRRGYISDTEGWCKSILTISLALICTLVCIENLPGMTSVFQTLTRWVIAGTCYILVLALLRNRELWEILRLIRARFV